MTHVAQNGGPVAGSYRECNHDNWAFEGKEDFALVRPWWQGCALFSQKFSTVVLVHLQSNKFINVIQELLKFLCSMLQCPVK